MPGNCLEMNGRKEKNTMSDNKNKINLRILADKPVMASD